jgi:hypothetical protein
MPSLKTKIGIAVGIVTTALLAIPMIKLVLGDCYFEQGCEPNENVKLIASLLLALSIGAFAGWLTSRMIDLIENILDRRQ